MTDEELESIRARDAARRLKITPGLPATGREEFPPLFHALQRILYQRGINNGNVYADWLASQLLSCPEVTISLPAPPAPERRQFVCADCFDFVEQCGHTDKPNFYSP